MAKQVRTVYGNALFEAARDAGRLTSVREEAETILEAFRLEPDFLRILCHPEILPEEKEGMLNAVFGENADPLILAIMEALLDKKHGGEIPKVLHAFVGLALEEEKIGVAEVTSAVELSDADKDKVRTKLLDTTAYETMRVSFVVDPSLIGGMIIKLKDKVVDSSVKTKLGHMKNRLLTGA